MPPRISKLVCILAVILLSACGNPSSSGSPGPSTSTTSGGGTLTPTPTASTSAVPAAPAGILFQGTPGGTYSLTLVFADGHLTGPVNAKGRTVGVPGQAAPAPIPEFSTSHDRVYYLDGDRDVHYLGVDGSSGLATHVPGTSHSQSGFAVSPDNRRIAVATIDYGTAPARLQLYVEDLVGGGSHTMIFTSTSSYVWPVGWHSGQLVLAVGEAETQNLPPNPYGTFSGYHVVDAATANRTFAFNCLPSGPLTAAGSACLSGGVPLVTIDFTGNPRRLMSVNGAPYDAPLGAAVSPDGAHVVFCCVSGQLELWDTVAGSTTSLGPVSGPASGWIDSSHLLTEGSLSPHPAVIDIGSGQRIEVNASGQVVGRVPGDV